MTLSDGTIYITALIKLQVKASQTYSTCNSNWVTIDNNVPMRMWYIDQRDYCLVVYSAKAVNRDIQQNVLARGGRDHYSRISM